MSFCLFSLGMAHGSPQKKVCNQSPTMRIEVGEWIIAIIHMKCKETRLETGEKGYEQFNIKGHRPGNGCLQGHRGCLCRPSRKAWIRSDSRSPQRGATQSVGGEPLKRERTAYHFHCGGPQHETDLRKVETKLKAHPSITM